MYYFKLDNNEINKAIEAGFNIASLPFMPNKIYKSTQLFNFFKMRLPKIEELRAVELEKVLKELDMKEFDEFEYLRKTKGKIGIDNFVLEENRM